MNIDERRTFNIKTQEDYIEFMTYLEYLILHTNRGIKIIPDGMFRTVDTFKQVEKERAL